LNPRAYNQRVGLCIACPVTNQAKGFPFEVALPAGHAVSGVVLADQIRSMSWFVRYLAVPTGREPVTSGLGIGWKTFSSFSVASRSREIFQDSMFSTFG
jgi:hypothetical protein